MWPHCVEFSNVLSVVLAQTCPKHGFNASQSLSQALCTLIPASNAVGTSGIDLLIEVPLLADTHAHVVVVVALKAEHMHQAADWSWLF